MSDWAVGLSTGCFFRESIFDCLEAIRNGGFCMVEICSFPAHLDYRNEQAVREATKRMDDLGMEPYSFHAPFSDEIDITALDEGRRNHSREEIFRAAHAAAEMSVRHFVIHPGPEKAYQPSAEERIQRLKHAADVLDQVAQHCQELGIGFVLENMLPHLMFGNMQDMMWIMGAIKRINVGACLDTGHAYLSGDIRSILYKLSGHLQLVHANDNRGDRDDHLPPGEGRIEWEQLLTDLSVTGFDGALILELAGDPQKSWQTILAEARKTRRYLRDLSKDLDAGKPPTVRAAYSSEQEGSFRR